MSDPSARHFDSPKEALFRPKARNFVSPFVYKDRQRVRVTKARKLLTPLLQLIVLAVHDHNRKREPRHTSWNLLQHFHLSSVQVSQWVEDMARREQDRTAKERCQIRAKILPPYQEHGHKTCSLRVGHDSIKGAFGFDIGLETV